MGIFGLATSSLLAQTSSQGAVQDQEFVIRKDRVLSLPTRLKFFEKLPLLPQPKGLDPFTYTITPFFLPIPAAKIQTEPATKEWKIAPVELFPGMVRVGYGNFLSPLIEGRYMSTKSKDLQYASKFYHQNFGKGPVSWREEESKESHTELAGNASYFLDEAEVFSSLSLRRDAYTYYGQDLGFVISPTLDYAGPYFKQNKQLLGNFNLGFRDLEKIGRIGYEGKFVLNGFRDSYAVREQELGFQGKGIVRPSSVVMASLGLSYFKTATKDLRYDLNRTYFSLRPLVQYTLGDFQFSGGVVLVSDNDSVASSKQGIRLFPVLKSTYQVSEKIRVNSAISGDVQRTTYTSFVSENPFLGPSKQLLNTVTHLEFSAGVEGLASEKLFYRAGLNIRRQTNLHFFVNSAMDSARFELVYDDKATVVQFNSALELKLSSLYALQTRVDLYHYALSSQQAAWHRPTWMLSMNHQFTPSKKIRMQANFNLMGGLKARGSELQPIMSTPKFQEIALNPIMDLQLKIDYAVSSRLSIFAEGNNLLNQRNMRWMNYPVRGIQGIGGVSFKF